MTNGYIQLVQNFYAAFGRGDIEFIIERLTPDVNWIMDGPDDIPMFGTRTGHDAVRAFFRDLDATHVVTDLKPSRFLAAEDMVVVWGRYAWTMRQSGRSDDTEWLHTFQFRDGQVCAWRSYNDTARFAAAHHAVPVGAKRAANG